jgi:hypothetical protein
VIEFSIFNKKKFLVFFVVEEIEWKKKKIEKVLFGEMGVDSAEGK